MHPMKKIERAVRHSVIMRARRFFNVERDQDEVVRRIDQALKLMERHGMIMPVERLFVQSPSREDFAAEMDQLEYRGVGAEIGVFEGEFSNDILSGWSGKLISIDPWIYFDSGYIDEANSDKAVQDGRCQMTKDLLKKFGDRSEIWRDLSVDAANKIDDLSLDFAYIDAQHHYEAVKEDINTWWPKIKPGGFLWGHDYYDMITEKNHFGVKSAVDEFAAEKKILPVTTVDGVNWMMVKAA